MPAAPARRRRIGSLPRLYLLFDFLFRLFTLRLVFWTSWFCFLESLWIIELKISWLRFMHESSEDTTSLRFFVSIFIFIFTLSAFDNMQHRVISMFSISVFSRELQYWLGCFCFFETGNGVFEISFCKNTISPVS